MRSILDQYLAVEARHDNRCSGRTPLDADKVAAVRTKAMAARSLPHGPRGETLRRIGREYGISRRTVQRYAVSHTFEVVIGGWRALFVVAPNLKPRIASAWEPVE